MRVVETERQIVNGYALYPVPGTQLRAFSQWPHPIAPSGASRGRVFDTQLSFRYKLFVVTE